MHEYLNAFQKLEFLKIKQYIRRYAVSSLGTEHIDELTPSSDLPLIRRSLELVSEMKRLLEADDPLPLDLLFDVRTSLARASIENYLLPPEELRKIAETLRISKNVLGYFARRKERYPLLFLKISGIHLDKVLEYNINQAIDEHGAVKDTASKELSQIRRQIADKNQSLVKNIQAILRSVSGKEWVQEEIITTREGRMVIPVKAEHKNQVPGFIHSASASGATVFIEPMETLEMNNEIRTLRFAEQREIERILRELSRQVGEQRETILADLAVLGEIDFLQAKGKYSIEVLGAEPRMKPSGTIELRHALHPVLIHGHGRGNVVPLDLELGGKCCTLVITGPNAGGKSVAMKTVGLLSLMAQSGCHIPAAAESELPVFTRLFVDMGDEQSIENDLSSFSSHLRNLKTVLESAGEGSLVLIDEIGNGTDPVEGSSLAAAVLERLARSGATTIVTTHHGALKTFAFENPRIQNGAMEFDQSTLTPTFHFRSGVPGSSYAIEMAERVRLPSEVIARSRELKGSGETKIEQLIIDLERQAQELKRTLDGATTEKEKLAALIEVYQTKITSLEHDLKTIKAKAVDEAAEIVRKANVIVERSVREIKESGAQKEIVKHVKQEMEELAREYSQLKETVDPAQAEHPRQFSVGDPVRIRNTDSSGVIEAKLGGDSYIVVVGGLKARITAGDLELTEHRDVGVGRQSYIAYQPEQVKKEIDLRGLYGDEALAAIDKFLDDAMLAGLHRIEIIHGKGTGALRKKISEHLKEVSSVKTFRLGEWNEGGSGVTIVELE